MLKKKWFLAAAALLLTAVFVLSSCSKSSSGGGTASTSDAGGTTAADSDSGGKTDSSDTKTADSSSGATDEAPPTDSDKGKYWLTDDKVTYSFLIPTVTDLNQFPFYQHLEEITNIHINWICMSGDNYQPYVNLMWASGDIPDMMRGLSGTDFATYAAQGQFFPINSMWEEYMPNLMAILDVHPEIGRRLQMPDGNVYAFTGIQGGVIQATSGAWIYQPWLDKLGLAMPTEIEEFVNVLTAFKEQDPNGNGKADEIPLALVPTPAGSWRVGQIHGWFGCSQDFLIQKGCSHLLAIYGKLADLC